MRAENSNTRLTIDVPSDMHRLIKAHATLSDLSIKDYIIETIEERFRKEGIVTKKMNSKTIATIKNSIKNHDKLKTFYSSSDAMKWLLEEEKSKKKKS